MRKPERRMDTRDSSPVQVAAVCYRHRAGATQLLLVRTTSGRWTFPKGQLEDGLSHAEVAALEAFEEAGVDGEVDPRPVGRYLHRKASLRGYGSKDITVVAFLMEVKSSVLPAESHRTPRWFTPTDAKHRLAQGRRAKYLRSVERVFESALRKIARNHSR